MAPQRKAELDIWRRRLVDGLIVSLFIKVIFFGGSSVVNTGVKAYASFSQLKSDRDSDKIEHKWFAQFIHKQDSINHGVSETIINYGADIDALTNKVITIDLQMVEKKDK